MFFIVLLLLLIPTYSIDYSLFIYFIINFRFITELTFYYDINFTAPAISKEDSCMICLGPLKIGNLYSSGSSTNQTCSHPFHFACIVERCRTQKGENEFKKLAPVQPTCPICVRPIKFLFPLDEENG